MYVFPFSLKDTRFSKATFKGVQMIVNFLEPPCYKNKTKFSIINEWWEIMGRSGKIISPFTKDRLGR